MRRGFERSFDAIGSFNGEEPDRIQRLFSTSFPDLPIWGSAALGCDISARNVIALLEETRRRPQGLVAAKAGVGPKAVVSLARRGRLAGLTAPGSVRTPVW